MTRRFQCKPASKYHNEFNHSSFFRRWIYLCNFNKLNVIEFKFYIPTICYDNNDDNDDDAMLLIYLHRCFLLNALSNKYWKSLCDLLVYATIKLAVYRLCFFRPLFSKIHHRFTITLARMRSNTLNSLHNIYNSNMIIYQHNECTQCRNQNDRNVKCAKYLCNIVLNAPFNALLTVSLHARTLFIGYKIIMLCVKFSLMHKCIHPYFIMKFICTFLIKYKFSHWIPFAGPRFSVFLFSFFFLLSSFICVASVGVRRIYILTACVPACKSYEYWLRPL